MKKYLFLILAISISQLMALNVSAQGALGWSTATDATGNVFVTGYFTTSITFGAITLKNSVSGTNDMFIVKYDPSGNVLWAISAGGGSNVGRNIATDGSGNAFVTGYFTGPSITFGKITLTNAASGNGDMYIVKYSASGTVLWAQRAGGSLMDVGSDIVTDGSGNVYVTGEFKSSSITFGNLPGKTITLINPVSGSWDMYIVKYDPNGIVILAAGWSGPNATGIATDGSGNVYVTGGFSSSSITFGLFTLTNPTPGSSVMFVVKCDPNGNVLSAAGWSGAGATGIATDGSGNVYVTGSFSSSTITFGETTLTNTSTSVLPEDMFIVKYDPSGSALWAKNAGGISVNRGSGVASDNSGNVYVTGTFCNYPITFGNTKLSNAGQFDIFIVKYYANDGTVLWAQSAGGSLQDRGFSIASDGSGNVYVAGDFQSSKITFGGITLNNTNGKNGLGDMYIAKYNASDTVLWAKCAGATPVGKPKSADAGINDLPANEITIYPNPTSGKVIVSTANSQSVIASISVFNLTGKEVLSRQSAVGSLPAGQAGQQIDVDLSSQPKGLYIVLIKAGDNYYRRKIIVE